MFRIAKQMLTAFVILTTAHTANAVIIDFESFPTTNFSSHSESGVTFTAVGGSSTILAAITPNGTLGILDAPPSGPSQELRADFSSTVSSVSVDLGDEGSDGDLLFLEVFNAADVLIGSTGLLIPSTFAGMTTLSVTAANISYAVFGSRFPSVNSSSVFADNFTFDVGGVAVSEPKAVSMMISALGIFWLVRRKRTLILRYSLRT